MSYGIFSRINPSRTRTRNIYPKNDTHGNHKHRTIRDRKSERETNRCRVITTSAFLITGVGCKLRGARRKPEVQEQIQPQPPQRFRGDIPVPGKRFYSTPADSGRNKIHAKVITELTLSLYLNEENSINK